MIQNRVDRRNFLKTIGIGTAALGLPGCWNTGNKQKNVLFILTDDQRYDTIHALGNSGIKTPTMDQLVHKGVSFTRAYIMGSTSGAVCMPSRAMLLSGRNVFHLKNMGASIPKDHIMLPEIFRQAGYETFGTGKWHNGREAYARCFTQGGKIMFGGMSNHLNVPVYDFDPTGEYPEKNQYTGEKFSSKLFSDAAIKFLKNHRSDKPFFMFVSYTAPHDPRMPPEAYATKYDPKKIKLLENFMPEHPFDNGELYIRDENLAPHPRTPEVVQRHIADYYAMITHLDDQIGRVLQVLVQYGKAEDTIVVFAGDNGLAVGQHGLMGKQNLYEHSIHVPLIFSGPGISKGIRADALCHIQDIYPTLCDLAGFGVPDSVEAKSLKPILRNRNKKVRDSLFFAYKALQRSVRTDDDWKLIKYNVKGKQRVQLFNLEEDPFELNNLMDQKEYASRLSEMTNLLHAHMRQSDDFCDPDKPNWGVPKQKYEPEKVGHLAVGKKVQFMNDATIKYNDSGPAALVDGMRASSRFDDGYWIGFKGEDLDAVIDLGKTMSIHKITAGFLEDQGLWSFHPAAVTFLISKDGNDFQQIKHIEDRKKEFNRFKIIKDHSGTFQDLKARYVRVKAENIGQCPDWHQGAGNKAWLFVDEIMVE